MSVTLGYQLLECLRDLPCYDKVIALAHAGDGLDDLAFVVLDDLDAFQVLPARLW